MSCYGSGSDLNDNYQEKQYTPSLHYPVYTIWKTLLSAISGPVNLCKNVGRVELSWDTEICKWPDRVPPAGNDVGSSEETG